MKNIIDIIKHIELRHFRTVDDTGANPCAITVMNCLRREVGLDYIFNEDLPAWDNVRNGYYMPENSKLLCAPEILARGGKV